MLLRAFDLALLLRQGCLGASLTGVLLSFRTVRPVYVLFARLHTRDLRVCHQVDTVIANLLLTWSRHLGLGLDLLTASIRRQAQAL